MTLMINVRRSVLTAALDLAKRAESIAGDPPFLLAAEKSDEHRAAGDEAGAQFWRDVSLYLMSVEVLGGEVAIAEDGMDSPDQIP
jgi:hypothetical protein